MGLQLTYFQQGAALWQRVEDGMREKSRIMQQLVLVFDAVVAVNKVQAGLLWRALRGRAAPCTSSQHFQAAVISTCILWGEGQVKKQALRQGCDVVQVAERGAGASPVGAAVLC